MLRCCKFNNLACEIKNYITLHQSSYIRRLNNETGVKNVIYCKQCYNRLLTPTHSIYAPLHTCRSLFESMLLFITCRSIQELIRFCFYLFHSLKMCFLQSNFHFSKQKSHEPISGEYGGSSSTETGSFGENCFIESMNDSSTNSPFSAQFFLSA